MPVTYDETRMWVYLLRTFTPSDLADSMGVTVESLEGFLIGLEYQETVMPTGEFVNGHGRELIYEFVPLPRGPTHHYTELPEWKSTPGVGSLAPRRGEPIRIRTDQESRRAGSMPGQGHRMKQAQKRYERHVEAVEKRRKKQEEKRIRKESYLD